MQKHLKNIIAFGPEKLGVDYRIHGADEYILVSEMEEAVLSLYGSNQESSCYIECKNIIIKIRIIL